MEVQNSLMLFRELISCDAPIYYWCYDGDGTLMASSCPEETVFHPIFRHSGCLNYAMSTQTEAPMILSGAANIAWAGVWEIRDDIRYRLHIIGPCLTSSLPLQVMEQARQTVAAVAEGSQEYKKRLLAGLERIPVVPVSVFFRYAVMLGRCVTGRQVPLSGLHHQSSLLEEEVDKPRPRDRKDVYRAERMLLRMVREGDLNSAAALTNAANVATPQPYVPDPLGQVQIAYTILTSLCTRAAIEGGLSPELAYSTGDSYIQRLFLTHTFTEAIAVKNQMYRDFVEKVHACRNDPKFSSEIQSCCDYLELHAEEPLTLELLAERLGYNKYYLSRRFKTEVGCTVNNYLQITRVERAKMLLSCTDRPVADIAAALQFATVSHFSVVFKRLAGQSPAQYRAERQSN